MLGLAGPGKRIAGILPITVIRRDDLADRLLDRKLNPEFHGERFSLLYAMPKQLDLWDHYNELRVAGLDDGTGLAGCTAFFRKHLGPMEEGARWAWPERYDRNAGEISALQHAMNLYFIDPYAFACEYQNAPPRDSGGDALFLDAAAIAERINANPRRLLPAQATRVVSFVDVQGSLLYYTVVGFDDDFTGWIVDYGTWPEQSRQYFTLAGASRRFAHVCEGATTVEAQIAFALRALIERGLAVRDWPRTDGAALRMTACLIDAQWGEMTDVIYEFIRTSAFPNVWPSHGIYIGASSQPQPATLDELTAGLPGADADFLLGQLKARATLGAAQAAFIGEQNKRIEQLGAKAKHLAESEAAAAQFSADGGTAGGPQRPAPNAKLAELISIGPRAKK